MVTIDPILVVLVALLIGIGFYAWIKWLEWIMKPPKVPIDQWGK